MSTRKDAQDLVKQVQSISDSIIPKIPKSLVQQSKSWYAASKAFGPGRLTSATFKIPSSTIKRLECLGSAYKIPKLAIPKDALKGIREHVMLSSAAYSIGSNSKLTELFDSGIIKSIQRQQKLFEPLSPLASAAKEFYVPQTSLLISKINALDIIGSIPSLHISPSFSAMDSLSKYAESTYRFKNNIDWDTVLNRPLNDSNFDDSVIDSWFNSAVEVIDDMAKQKWLQEESDLTSKNVDPPLEIIPFSQLPPYRKMIEIIMLIAALIGITSGALDIIAYFREANPPQPPAVHMELNENDEKIITCQTDLFDSVTSHLALNDSQD